MHRADRWIVFCSVFGPALIWLSWIRIRIGNSIWFHNIFFLWSLPSSVPGWEGWWGRRPRVPRSEPRNPSGVGRPSKIRVWGFRSGSDPTLARSGFQNILVRIWFRTVLRIRDVIPDPGFFPSRIQGQIDSRIHPGSATLVNSGSRYFF